jgi:hypothetical protein
MRLVKALRQLLIAHCGDNVSKLFRLAGISIGTNFHTYMTLLARFAAF